MKRQLVILPRADCDQAEIFEYLAARSLAVAHRFVDRLTETLDHLCAQSEPGMRYISEDPQLAALRWAKVREFPNHLIFFRISRDMLEVARVLHGARDIETILGA